MVDGVERAVGLGGDDGGGLQLFAVRSHPAFPYAGEGDRAAGPWAHDIGALVAAVLPPFVETVGGDEAAAALHGVFERRLVVDRFAARVDEQAKPARVLDPGRDQ